MEKLTKRADGFSETQSGDLAVFMLRGKAVLENDVETNIFNYRSSFTGPIMHLYWRGKIAIFEEETSRFLVERGYARNLTDFEVEGYNEAASEAQGKKPFEEPSVVLNEPVSEPLEGDNASVEEVISDDNASPNGYDPEMREVKRRGRKPKSMTDTHNEG